MVEDLLAGVRVLDLTNVLAGPFTGYQLALVGADVIKVEVPGSGDLARQLGADANLNAQRMGTSFLAQNGGKRSISLNLKTQAGKAIFLRLVSKTDVLLENFRPGVMDRLGLSYAVLARQKPDLIYCAISGYGQTGSLSASPAYDQIIQGKSGLMSITGDAQSAPLRVGFPVCDTMGGMTATFAIAAALVRRDRNGSGGFIDVSMLDSAIVSMGWIVSNRLIAGCEPVPMGNDNFTASPSGTFKTGDGLLNIAANKQEQFESLCEVLGAPDIKNDARFQGRESRKRYRAELRQIIESLLASHDAGHWETRLNRAGVPAGQVLSVAEALQQQQVEHRGLLMSLPLAHDEPGKQITVMRSGFTVDGQPTHVKSPPPRLGQHNEEILQEAGYSQDQIQQWMTDGTL